MSLTPILEINLKAVQANYGLITQKLDGECISAAMVKADAYGLGAKMVAPALEQAGCNLFFVATLNEALALRHHTNKQIAVLNGCTKADKADFVQYQLIPVINTLEQVDIWNDQDGSFFLHIDTGMNRLGLSIEDVPAFLQTGKKPALVMSHFACADEANHPMNASQNTAFSSIIDLFWAAEQDPLFSLANSSGIFRSADYHYDVVRPGMALYGLNPVPEKANPMQPVLSLKTPILQTRMAYAGESVGYSATYTLKKDSLLATVPMGYADGFHRSGGKSVMFWNDAFGPVGCPVVGRVSMDLIVVDLSAITGPPPVRGDTLEILGPHLDADGLASLWGTIGYEVLTSLGHRYQRIYV